MSDTEFIIIADYPAAGKAYDGCLIYACGKDRAVAEKSLDRILNNPSEQDKEKIEEGACNFRIKEVVSKDCWWNDPFLAN